ncbi:hypothetical protein QBC33DRAFT_238395 [Phialemonium atrogriseum]|uniref:Uncharacterized protein n=1 Tax=Phialemonium atrogriseum TaxID=1093897 RepID=A0AAJ0C6V4_9PEZI|nr:uncharacterized protein QBC33DRAFT_238395 [Phialemonium atrogriseum]KAK1771248.1 hypothetical protein QBC33DRAFT_238395 [Phialemonium atrogriseum]
MGSFPESPTSIRSLNRDTGFPEPFCGSRNTTLPHPDADLSPDACISDDNIAAHRVLSRHRPSFLIKHKHTISHGMITPAMERRHGDPTLLEEEELATVDSQRSRRSTRDGNESIMSTEGSSRGGSGGSHSHSMDGRSPKSRGSIFRRLIHH